VPALIYGVGMRLLPARAGLEPGLGERGRLIEPNI
jgi:hypothetical protein